MALPYLREHAAIGNLPEAVVVGIGYAADTSQPPPRFRTLTPPAERQNLPPQFQANAERFGGAGTFRQFIMHELKPYLYARASINRACETLYGHSLGGLFALDTMFRSPEAFDYYVAFSPSIQWNAKGLLELEPAFLAAMNGAGDPVRAHIVVSANEEEITTEVRAMAERFASRQGSERFQSSFAILADESHASAGAVGAIRAIRIGSQCTLP